MGGSLSRVQLAIAVLLAVVVVVGACVVIARTFLDESYAVVVVGDSVTAMSEAQIQATVHRAGGVKVSGHPGYRTDELLPVADPLFHDRPPPEVGVVMSGYNDILHHVDPTEAIVEMMGWLDELDCGIWLLIPTKGVFPADDLTRFNEQVQFVAATTEDVHIETGWRDAVDATDDHVPDRDLVGEDLLHPTEEGSQVIADSMAEAIERWC